jgi:hypothetical protein
MRTWRGLRRGQVPAHLAADFARRYTPMPNGCWEWQRGRFPTGYGMVNLGRWADGRQHTEYAHRVSYVLHHGPIPGGEPRRVVMHSCDNPACVNPAHLSLGTQRENVQQAYDTGRATGPVKYWVARACCICKSRPRLRSGSRRCAECYADMQRRRFA